MVPRPDGHELSYFISALASAYVTIKRLKIEEEKKAKEHKKLFNGKNVLSKRLRIFSRTKRHTDFISTEFVR